MPSQPPKYGRPEFLEMKKIQKKKKKQNLMFPLKQPKWQPSHKRRESEGKPVKPKP